MKRQRKFLLAICLALAASAARAGAQQTPQKLTLQDAIQLALKKNVDIQISATEVGEAEGTRTRNLAVLLPHASGDALANLLKNNLSIEGLSFPGIPKTVGPYAYYDFRVFASQSIVDRQAYHRWKASIQQEDAARLSYQDTRDAIVREAAGLYLQSETAEAEIEAAQSRVQTSQILEKLAIDQHDQGLATAIDVVRAQVELARDQQSLLVAEDNYQTSLLALARFLGLSPGTPLELAEKLQFRHIDAPDIDQVLPAALAARDDYRALSSEQQSLLEQQEASHARYFPTLSVNGNYGAAGRNFGTMPSSGGIEGVVSITIFDKDRSGEKQQLESRAERLKAQVGDLARSIEQDLRKAVLDIHSAEQQVNVTQANLDLARRELTLAEDRFRNGVTDNIEVITAQDALTTAQDNHIAAIAEHEDAAAALARALGATEKNYQKYVGATASAGGSEGQKGVNQP
ncbi:MAG TPA: TolC family protein [Candidatus Acidoferrales bacterium]|nr:TolC family protein [Candidatus Acidoferrales bacterium]